MNEHFQFKIKTLDKPVPMLEIFTTEHEDARKLDDKVRKMIYDRLDDDSFNLMTGLRKPSGNVPQRILQPVVDYLTKEGIEVDAQIGFMIGAYYASIRAVMKEKQEGFMKENGLLVALLNAVKPERELTDEEIEQMGRGLKDDRLNLAPKILGCSGDCENCSEEDKKKFHEKMGPHGNGNAVAMEIIKGMADGTAESPDWVKEMLKEEKKGDE